MDIFVMMYFLSVFGVSFSYTLTTENPSDKNIWPVVFFSLMPVINTFVVGAVLGEVAKAKFMVEKKEDN